MTKRIKLKKWGNSQGIRIPKYILESMDLLGTEEVSFEVVVKDGEICLKPIVDISPYAQLFKGYDFSKPRATFKWDE